MRFRCPECGVEGEDGDQTLEDYGLCSECYADDVAEYKEEIFELGLAFG